MFIVFWLIQLLRVRLLTNEPGRRCRVQPSVYRCGHVEPSDQSVCQCERVELDERPSVPSDGDVAPNGVPNDDRSDDGVGSAPLRS